MTAEEIKKKLDNINKVLKEIQDKAPSHLLKLAYKEKKIAPVVEKVVDIALNDPDFDKDIKEKLQIEKDLGRFSKTKLEPVQKYVVQLDNYFSREVNKAIKEGRLPSRKKAMELRKLYDEIKKRNS